MAKIDVSTIEGYAEMSAEEKLAALENYPFPDPDYTGYVKKELFDKKASELAAANKKLGEKMSEEEKTKEEQERHVTELEEKVAKMEKEKTIATYKADFIGKGYREDLAQETAEALANGDMTKVLANQKTFIEELTTKVKAEALGDFTTPPAGGVPGKTSIGQRLGQKKAAAYKAAKDNLKQFR